MVPIPLPGCPDAPLADVPIDVEGVLVDASKTAVILDVAITVESAELDVCKVLDNALLRDEGTPDPTEFAVEEAPLFKDVAAERALLGIAAGFEEAEREGADCPS